MSQPPEFTEEELRAMEAEMERITVDDVLLQTIVSLINLTARKAGLAAAPTGAPPTPDWAQVRQGIEGARALLPLVEPRHAEQLAPIREGLSQLQMHYVQHSGGAPLAEGAPAPQAGEPPEPAARPEPPSRLWVPGQ